MFVCFLGWVEVFFSGGLFVRKFFRWVWGVELFGGVRFFSADYCFFIFRGEVIGIGFRFFGGFYRKRLVVLYFFVVVFFVGFFRCG